MASGTLYVVTEGGFMYALDDIYADNPNQEASIPSEQSSP